MEILDLRKIVAGLLAECEVFERVLPIGNVVYVHVADREYEVVLRTVRPNMSKPITNPDQDGPVAQ